MSSSVVWPMLRVAFAGAFSARLADRVRAHLTIPCDVILVDEVGITAEPPDLEARAKVIAENIRRVARGEPPVNLIPASE